jgi:uncharacterized protein (TIGR03067 family)
MQRILFAGIVTLALLVTLLPGQTLAGPPGGVSGKMVFDDATALQGPSAWRAVEVVRNGKVDKEPETVVITFVGDTFVWQRGDMLLFRGTYHLDASRSPKDFDMRPTFGPLGEIDGWLWPGVYRLDGDWLKLCVRMMIDEGRPKRFASEKTSHDWLVTFKREKP